MPIPAPTANPKPVSPDGTYPGLEEEYGKEVRRYRDRLEASAKYLEKRFHKRAMRMVEYYELNHYMNPETGEETEAGEDRVKVAYPYSNVRQTLAEIYVKDPTPMVTPKRRKFPVEAKLDDAGAMVSPAYEADGVEGAKLLKSAVKYVVRKSNFKRATKMTLLEGIPTGLSCVMLSAQKGSKVPKYVRVQWRDLVFSHEVADVYDSPWIARRVVEPLDEIRENPDYNANRDKVAPAKLDPKVYGDRAATYGVLWHVFDKQADRHLLIPDGLDCDLYDGKTVTEDYDLKVESDEFACDWPFTFFVNEETIKHPWGLGDVAPIESQVQERDRIRSYQVRHLSRFNRKYMAKAKFLDDQAMDALTNGGDGAIVTVKEDITDLSFRPVQDAPISGDAYNVDEVIQRDIDTIQAIGANAVARGVGDRPGTLGEAQIIEGNADTRLGEKRDNAADFYARLFRLTAQFIQQHWVESDWLLMSGDGSKESDWVEYDPAKAKGEYDFDVDPESSRDNSALYRKQAQEALSVLTPLLTAPPAPPPVPGMPPMPAPLPMLATNPHLAVMARRFVENFKCFEKDVDAIVPEAWTQPTEQAVPEDPEADAMLLEEIGGGDPDAFVDRVAALPENERAAIQTRVQRLLGSAAPSEAPLPAAVTRP